VSGGFGLLGIGVPAIRLPLFWSEVKLKADHTVDGFDVLSPEGAQPPQQAPLVGCSDLIGHDLAPVTLQRNVGFRRIQTFDLA
jgi:hypothetical protein